MSTARDTAEAIALPLLALGSLMMSGTRTTLSKFSFFSHSPCSPSA
jgi:hypothetical protein